MAGTASRNRGPETSPAPAPAAPGGGETVERLKSKDQGTTPIKPHTYVSLQGDRFLTSSRKRGPRTVSGSSGVPPQQSIPGGPSSSMPSGNKDSGGRNRVPRWSSGPGLRSRSPLTREGPERGGGAGRHPGLFSQTRGALQRTQVAVERATPLETAWISFLLIQELFNVLELNAGKSGEGGVGAATEALTNPPQPKERGTAPGVEPRQRRGSSGFLLLGGTHSHEGRNRGGGRGPPRAAEGEPRGLLVL